MGEIKLQNAETDLGKKPKVVETSGGNRLKSLKSLTGKAQNILSMIEDKATLGWQTY